MTPTVSDALQDCLDQVESGLSSEQALARHPDLREAVEPLLAAALLVRAERPRPRTAFRADLQVALANEAASQGPLADQAASGRGRRRLVTRLGGALAGSMLALSLLVFASADSRPGQPLHVVRRSVERLSRESGRAMHIAADVMQQRSPFGIDATARRVPTPRVTPTVVPRKNVEASSNVATREERPAAPGTDRSSQPVGAAVAHDSSEVGAAGQASGAGDASGGAGHHVPQAPAVPATGESEDRSQDAADKETLDSARGPSVEPGRDGPAPRQNSPTSTADTSHESLVVLTPPPSPTATPMPERPGGGAPRPTATQPMREPPNPPPTRQARDTGGVAGAVRQSVGVPYPGVLVVAVPESWLRQGPRRPAAPRRWVSRTGADGRYRIVGLPPGRYLIGVVVEPRAKDILWYENAGDPEHAEVLTIGPGKVLTGISFKIPGRGSWLPQGLP